MVKLKDFVELEVRLPGRSKKNKAEDSLRRAVDRTCQKSEECKQEFKLLENDLAQPKQRRTDRKGRTVEKQEDERVKNLKTWVDLHGRVHCLASCLYRKASGFFLLVIVAWITHSILCSGVA